MYLTKANLNKKLVSPLYEDKERADVNELAFKLLLLHYAMILWDNGKGIMISDLTDDELMLVTVKLVDLIIKMSQRELDIKMSVVCNTLLDYGFSEKDLEELTLSEII